jgi:hypothetical protein
MTRSAAFTCSTVDMFSLPLNRPPRTTAWLACSRIPVLTQEFVLFAIIAVAVVSLLLLDYSTT